MSEEYFDVVDADDRVVGRAARSLVHAKKLRHRAVHIFVFNGRRELLIHLRTASKEEFPDVWTSSASGHVSAGEAYRDAARRELSEELGLSGNPEFLHKFAACAETSWEHTELYRFVSDEPPVFDREEIAAGAFHAVDEIARKLVDQPERFSPAFRLLFAWYRERPTQG